MEPESFYHIRIIWQETSKLSWHSKQRRKQYEHSWYCPPEFSFCLLHACYRLTNRRKKKLLLHFESHGRWGICRHKKELVMKWSKIPHGAKKLSLKCDKTEHVSKTKWQRALKVTFINLMFGWPCITVYQYSENNVIQLLFNLLRIKGIYTFRALLTHAQEALNKRHLVYCGRVMSVGCSNPGAANWQHTRNIPSAVCEEPPEDEHVMLETLRGS
jgi:hypothetical protein